MVDLKQHHRLFSPHKTYFKTFIPHQILMTNDLPTGSLIIRQALRFKIEIMVFRHHDTVRQVKLKEGRDSELSGRRKEVHDRCLIVILIPNMS